MMKSLAWIQIVAAAATLSLHGEEAEGGVELCLNESAVKVTSRCAKDAAPDAALNEGSNSELEAVALELILRKHGKGMSEVEQSILSSAISRLEGGNPEPDVRKFQDLGVSVAPLDESVRRHMQPQIEGGLMVTGTEAGGLLSFWGVGEHDLIVSANGKSLHNAQALEDVLEGSVEKNTPLLLELIVQGNRRTINLRPLRNRELLKPGASRFWQFRGC